MICESRQLLFVHVLTYPIGWCNAELWRQHIEINTTTWERSRTKSFPKQETKAKKIWKNYVKFVMQISCFEHRWTHQNCKSNEENSRERAKGETIKQKQKTKNNREHKTSNLRPYDLICDLWFSFAMRCKSLNQRRISTGENGMREWKFV